MMKSEETHPHKAKRVVPPRPTLADGIETDGVQQGTVLPRLFGAADVALDAKRQLAAIIGLEIDRVSAVEHEDDGWHVTVDVVELRRIPASTDVLAAYEATLDESGRLLTYHRTIRYFRDQMLEAS